MTDRLPDIIFVSMENWDDVWRRNQFLCTGLARRYPETKILFVGLPRDVSHDIRMRRMPDLRGIDTSVPDYPNITVTRPLKLLPNSIPFGRRFNEALYRASVRYTADRIGIKRPILWLNPHWAVHMVRRMHERRVIYDITDDWAALTQSRRQMLLAADQDARLCRRADAVIVCSKRLSEIKQSITPKLFLIPNGVDADHYRSVLDGNDPLPAIGATWAHPVLGYTGTIHPDRVDVDLLVGIAGRLKQGTIALIGPDMLSAHDRRRLEACGNIVLTGPIPYAEVPGVIRAFDVSIVPHRVTPFTESLNPIKLWEYLAAGKPIVSTDVAGFRDYPQFVRLAGDAQAFIKSVHEAIAEAPGIKEARRYEARKNSWQSRIDSVVDVLRGVESRSAAGEGPLPAPRPDPPAVSSIVVSYSTRDMTLRCLRDLDNELAGIPSEIIVVDNASRDGSVQAIRASFPDVNVIENPNNRGFGAANNIGLAQARGTYILLLNSDAFMRPGSIRTLMRRLDDDSSIGIVGPRLFNADGSVQESVFPFPSPMRAWIENLGAPHLGGRKEAPISKGWLSGACILTRKVVFETIGGFDEGFFLYQEETDWQLRMKQSRWSIAFEPAAEVVHVGGASGLSEKVKVDLHFFNSLDYFMRKHFGIAGLISVRLAMIVGSAMRTVVWSMIAVAAPKSRMRALSAARLQAWLLVRQATQWSGAVSVTQGASSPTGAGKGVSA